MGLYFQMSHLFPGRKDILKDMFPDVLCILEEVRLPDESNWIVVEAGKNICLIRGNENQRDFLIDFS